MPVGDPRRPLIGRAAFGTLLASAVFFVFTVTKQVKPVYFHAPWLNDPYDTVFSFTMFFVPLAAAASLIQVPLCRKSEALPIVRVVGILRGCRVAVAAMMIELLTAWVAVAVGANRPEWTGGSTGALVALLTLSTVVTAKVIVDLTRAPRLPSPAEADDANGSDWLADVVAVMRRASYRLGPLERPGLNALDWTERTLVSKVRRHPLVAAALASAAFAATVFGWQALREGYLLSVTLLEMGLGFCGMFAFQAIAGSYLGVVRSPNRLYGVQRRAVDASVAASLAAIAALAFRDSLWWIVGSTSSAAGPPQFAALAGSATLGVFLAVLTVETVLQSHPGTAR
jgi:hypothetical protein